MRNLQFFVAVYNETFVYKNIAEKNDEYFTEKNDIIIFAFLIRLQNFR